MLLILVPIFMMVSLLQLTQVADFSHVQNVETLLSDFDGHRKAVVQIKVAGTMEPLIITCGTMDVAESIADLIDRYCRLVNGTNLSLWNKRSKYIGVCFCLNDLAQPSRFFPQASAYKSYGSPCHYGKVFFFKNCLHSDKLNKRIAPVGVTVARFSFDFF